MRWEQLDKNCGFENVTSNPIRFDISKKIYLGHNDLIINTLYFVCITSGLFS